MKNKKINTTKKMVIAGVNKVHFYIYLSTFTIGILSSIFIIYLSIYNSSSVIDYFISLSSSLVITPLFAYFIDFATYKKMNTEKKSQKLNCYSPIIVSIIGMLFKFLPVTENLNKNQLTLKDFHDATKLVLNDYIECINQLSTGSRDLKLVNKSFNIKNIEIYSIRELENNIKILLDSQESLVLQNIISREDFYYFNMLYNDVKETKLPYLSSENDKNISKAYVDWPKTPLSDIDKNNLFTQFSKLYNSIELIANSIKEFECLKKLIINNEQLFNR